MTERWKQITEMITGSAAQTEFVTISKTSSDPSTTSHKDESHIKTDVSMQRNPG